MKQQHTSLKSAFQTAAKTTIHWILCIFFIGFLCEYGSYIVLTIHDSHFPRSRTQDGFKANTAPTDDSPDDVLHPYLGFVANHATTPGIDESFPVSNYGFEDTKDPIQKRAADKIIIGILGGSFANHFAKFGTETLLKEMKRNPLFAGKTFVVLNLALPGYKQPQQLMTLTYLLSLGSEFDMLVNIDGFNSLALSVAENAPKNVSLYYPRHWFYLDSSLPSWQMKLRALQSMFWGSFHRQIGIWFSTPPFNKSYAMTLIGRLSELVTERIFYHNHEQLLKLKIEKGSYAVTGPQKEYKNESELFSDLASVWMRSSLTLDQLSKANGIKYFHFLQPNQYVKGSKTLSPQELKFAYSKDQPYREPVEKGYPYLIEAGKELTKRGVFFHDYTLVFQNHAEQVYTDNCCHISKQANADLGKIIGDQILQDLAKGRNQEGLNS